MNLENDAFDREYFDEFSWEQLQEDEQGHLRPLVCTTASPGPGRAMQRCTINPFSIRPHSPLNFP